MVFWIWGKVNQKSLCFLILLDQFRVNGFEALISLTNSKPEKMAVAQPFNIKKRIDQNRHLLKPPVGNQQVYKGNDDFIVMVVGGPNSRKDYHYDEGEEFFYQLEGDIILKIIEDEKPRDIEIKQGEIYLLPPRVPHSPRRPAHTIGLVIERYRKAGEKDGLIWHCENCGNKLYEELPPIMERFWSNPEHTTCKNCGTVMEK